MQHDLRIKNFRGFREFSMSGLGRLNLLVGSNNCGKTTVLEAIHFLSVPGSPSPVWQAQLRRGELIEGVSDRQLDVSRLVHGYRLEEGSGFYLAGDSPGGRQELAAVFIPRELGAWKNFDEEEENDNRTGENAAPELLPPLSLQLEWSIASSAVRRVLLPITRRGGLSDRIVVVPPRAADAANAHRPVAFIATEGLSRDTIVSIFDSIVLTPDEAIVLQALHAIEPSIERIATVGTNRRASWRDVRGGMVMMVAGKRVPVGSLGDGIWRLLGIALALARARGGVLLVDEIDTGLHYSVLVDMWRLVLETARNLDVQVFATTHSRDCYEALAAVTEPGRTEISLQRIERGKVEAVAFTELEIRQAADRGLEVR
jgi:energy-coupling factor transporter ATP-binding protein EcfA2